jgi:MFS-type transporter involved in bile tolerance (Atg22 family)
LLIFLGNNTPLYYILVSLAVLGLGFGFFASPNTNAIMSSVDKKIYGVASGTLGTMRVSGQMISLVLCTMLFNIIIGSMQIIPANYPQFLQSVHIVFIISAVLCFIGIFASIARGKRNPQATS